LDLRKEAAGGWRKLYDEELHNLYSSPYNYQGDQIKEDKMGAEGRKHETDEKFIHFIQTISVGKPEEKDHVE
jgi:hypothetical protein